MKKENLEKAQKAVDEIYQLEYFLQGLKGNKFDLEINGLSFSQKHYVLRHLTESEHELIKVLKEAIFVVFRQVAERRLANLEAESKKCK